MASEKQGCATTTTTTTVADPALMPLVASDPEDNCPICREVLFQPATTHCQPVPHTACLSCLMDWAGSPSLPWMNKTNSEKIELPQSVQFKCPCCRNETTSFLDAERQADLKSKYPLLHAAREAEHEKEGRVFILVGNNHRRVPPSISPYTGMIRESRWMCFVAFDRPELVDSVDFVLHETYQERRLITRRKPPFQISQLAWGSFEVQIFITLKEGWEWANTNLKTLNSGAERPHRSPKDRLLFPWYLNFLDDGWQRARYVGVRRLEEDEDQVLQDIGQLFSGQ